MKRLRRQTSTWRVSISHLISWNRLVSERLQRVSRRPSRKGCRTVALCRWALRCGCEYVRSHVRPASGTLAWLRLSSLLLSLQERTFCSSPDMPLWVKPGSLATIKALDQLRKEPELEWSYLSPSAELKPGQRTGKFRLGNDQLVVDATGQSKISIQDYAVAMIDELERPTHVRQRFTVGY